ncbi:hypothetical protein T4A_10464, partial [Trichinella pseudospiralis]
LHAIRRTVCYANVNCPKREIYQIFQKITDCGILEIWRILKQTVLVVRMIKLFHKTN